MRITVFGAAGNVGSRVIAEALSRGHEIVAVLRDPLRPHGLPAAVKIRHGDARRVQDVAELSIGQDVVISATRPAPGSEEELATTAKVLLDGLAGSSVRLYVVGGAASLTIPGTAGTLVVEDPNFPAAVRNLALACKAQLEVFRGDKRVDWVYLSPPALLQPGIRSGKYRRGTDELLVDKIGTSAISMEDLAVALLDEIEQPMLHNTRFTVAAE